MNRIIFLTLQISKTFLLECQKQYSCAVFFNRKDKDSISVYLSVPNQYTTISKVSVCKLAFLSSAARLWPHRNTARYPLHQVVLKTYTSIHVIVYTEAAWQIGTYWVYILCFVQLHSFKINHDHRCYCHIFFLYKYKLIVLYRKEEWFCTWKRWRRWR